MRLESISTEFGNRLRYRQKHIFYLGAPPWTLPSTTVQMHLWCPVRGFSTFKDTLVFVCMICRGKRMLSFFQYIALVYILSITGQIFRLEATFVNKFVRPSIRYWSFCVLYITSIALSRQTTDNYVLGQDKFEEDALVLQRRAARKDKMICRGSFVQ